MFSIEIVRVTNLLQEQSPSWGVAERIRLSKLFAERVSAELLLTVYFHWQPFYSLVVSVAFANNAKFISQLVYAWICVSSLQACMLYSYSYFHDIFYHCVSIPKMIE